MRAIALPTLLACVAPAPFEPDPPVEWADGSCVESWRPLEGDEPAPWGTSPTLVRAALTGAGQVEDDEGATFELGLASIGGREALVFATIVEPLLPEPPGWCERAVLVPARLALRWGPEPVEVIGELRGIGAPDRLRGAFTGWAEIGAIPLDAPDGAARWAVWVDVPRGGAGIAPSGEIRPVFQTPEGLRVGDAARSFR